MEVDLRLLSILWIYGQTQIGSARYMSCGLGQMLPGGKV